MAFEELTKSEFRGRAALRDTVGVVTYGKTGTPNLRVSNDVYRRLGAPNFVKMMMGTGKHTGLVAFVPKNVPSDNTYKFTVAFHGRGLAKVSLPYKSIGIPKDANAELPFEITEDGLVVDFRQLVGAPKLAVAS